MVLPGFIHAFLVLLPSTLLARDSWGSEMGKEGSGLIKWVDFVYLIVFLNELSTSA